MRKIFVVLFAVLACVFLLNADRFITTTSAQDNAGSKNTGGDAELAQTIRLLTDRSTDGLRSVSHGDGSVSMDITGRFQNVVLSRIGADGQPTAACVTGLGEAYEFFGKNLETGEPLSSVRYDVDTVSLGGRHAMSRQEYEFLKKMIEDSAIRHARNPEAATLTIVNNDGAGEGFNDPTVTLPEGGNNGLTRGEQRLILFNFAASIWGAFLDSSVTINIGSQFNPLAPCSPGGGVLGSAGSGPIFRDFPNGQPGTWYHGALANKLAGFDLGANPEITAQFNSDVDNGCLGAGTRFYYGLDNTTPGGRVNLLVVLLHEMGHGLGFSSFVNGTTGAFIQGFPDHYSRLMFDRTTGKYWHEMSVAERQASALNSGNVMWDGPNVKTASGFVTNGRDAATGRVQLFSPNPFQQGSSISHFDSFVFPNVLMEPSINFNLPLTLDLTRQQMRDAGWYRDTDADLVPDIITNVVPGGGTIVVGTNTTITWAASGGFDRNVTIEMSTDGGLTYPTTIATDVTNTGSFSFTVPNTPTSQGRIRVREHDFVAPAGVSAANFTISTTAANADFDYDADGKTDISVYRPGSTGTWYIQRSQAGFYGLEFGGGADKIVPADYDGDNKTDIAVYRPSEGMWYRFLSATQSFLASPWGAATDIPTPGDFDHDGRADIAIFRPSDGNWWLNRSTAGTLTTQFGQNLDVPVVGDYDGDGTSDIGVFRPANGLWFIRRSTAGDIGYLFGFGTDKVTPADYDGDGKTDIAVYRPATGQWFIVNSGSETYPIHQFGAPTDIPVPGDYDGDGRADVAIFRPSDGNWWIQRTTAGLTVFPFGQNGDRPTPYAFGN